MAHLDAGEELPGAGAAERRQDDQRAAQRAPGAWASLALDRLKAQCRNTIGLEKHRET